MVLSIILSGVNDGIGYTEGRCFSVWPRTHFWFVTLYKLTYFNYRQNCGAATIESYVAATEHNTPLRHRGDLSLLYPLVWSVTVEATTTHMYVFFLPDRKCTFMTFYTLIERYTANTIIVALNGKLSKIVYRSLWVGISRPLVCESKFYHMMSWKWNMDQSNVSVQVTCQVVVDWQRPAKSNYDLLLSSTSKFNWIHYLNDVKLS